MAKRWKQYEAETPQRELQDALDERYTNAEEFFAQLAGMLTIRQDSASGTFYGFLNGNRPLPKAHRAAYTKLLDVTPELLDKIDDARGVTTPQRRDRLAEVEAEVEDLTTALKAANLARERLRRRLLAVEDSVARLLEAQPGEGSTRRERTGP